MHEPATYEPSQQHVNVHHSHVALVLLELLPLHEVEHAEEQDALQAIYHYHVDHVDNFLVDCDLILKSVVLNKSAIRGRIVIWLNF